jgi:hypothetical protein
VVFLGTTLVSYASANPYTKLHLPQITIQADGTITPQTASINRVGTTYTLTSDILHEYSIVILCSNIIFDGAGHTLDVTVEGSFRDGNSPAAYVDVGINLQQVNNVTVKNVIGKGGYHNINLQGSDNCQITGVTCSGDIRILGNNNTITESSAAISLFEGNDNLITKNNISSVFVGGSWTSDNRFYLNNFYLTDMPSICSSCSWDNGTVGNYWSDYHERYPYASEVGTSGIANCSYLIIRGSYSTNAYPNVSEIDHFPLMSPYVIDPVSATDPEYVLPVIVLIGVIAVATCVGVFYFRKRRLGDHAANSVFDSEEPTEKK